MIRPAPAPEEFEPIVVELADAQTKGVIEALEVMRDHWKQVREGATQEYEEDEIHQTITICNSLIERADVISAIKGPDRLKLHNPTEMETILESLLSLLQNFDRGEIEYEPGDQEEAIKGYKAILNRFTEAHWEEDPLTKFWFEYGDFTPDSPEDPILEAITNYGSRTHLLRELMARLDRNYSLAAADNPTRLNADPDDPKDIAKKFISEWDSTRESMTQQRYGEWLEKAEQHVGYLANKIEDTYQNNSRPPATSQ